MDRFQDLPRQFGRVWSSKIFNGFEIFLVVLGGSTLIKKTMKWKEQEFYARAMAELPRYQGLTLRFAVNIDFSFLNKLFGLKIDDK